ncbi:MAG: helix-turn-helix domain-containing protein [Clostridia bacterium]|nr:helix-turn-helix domain-containing protein [Clostridia bacterium]
MDQYVTGAVIRELREKKGLTQAEFAEKLFVSDKAVSKWESGKGYPDITLLEPIAKALDISVSELLAGRTVENVNVSASMLRSKFYVCPVCGNIFHSMGEAAISCHGILLTPQQAEETDEQHMIFIEGVEDEYFVRIEHDMTKQHYISFVAAMTPDSLQLVKLYPEGNAEARLKMRAVKRIFFYCNRDGLFSITVNKAIHGRPGAYDDTAERRALEDRAKKIFG